MLGGSLEPPGHSIHPFKRTASRGGSPRWHLGAFRATPPHICQWAGVLGGALEPHSARPSGEGPFTTPHPSILIAQFVFGRPPAQFSLVAVESTTTGLGMENLRECCCWGAPKRWILSPQGGY